MEKWNLYVKPVYEAVPWPFACDWNAFLLNPQPLVRACDHLTCPSPCDGLSETPTVPPNLPRALPSGRHHFAIYHDPAALYVFLASVDGPPETSDDLLRAETQLKNVSLRNRCVTIFSADARALFRFTHDHADRPLASASKAGYGPRASAHPAPPWTADYAFHVLKIGEMEMACWRIGRACLAPALIGTDTLRLSVSRLDFAAVEAVAWGSLHVWDPRFDEAGLVRLVAEPSAQGWPEVERLDMDYDPAAETARFTCRWSGLPPPEETFGVPRGKGFKARPVPWQSVSIRAGGLEALLPMAETVRTEAIPLPDGISRIQAAAPSGPAVTLHLEKRSGNRLRLPEWLDPAAVSDSGLRAFPAGLRAECDEALAEFEKRRQAGEKPEYLAWCTYHACGYGRAWQSGVKDPRLLELLREQADMAVSLQRPDGTFAGFHLITRAGPPRVPWQGGAYDTGPAGELYDVAAALLKDPKYDAAATRLLAAYRGYRVEFNHNYAAFALFHLAEHYRRTRNPEALELGLFYCRISAAKGLLPLGFQGGHNYYTCYGAITLRGMARFCEVLPESHPERPVLRERCLRMGNQLLSRLQPDGLFDSMDRYFLGERQWSFGPFSLAFIAGPVNIGPLDTAIRFMLEKKAERTTPAEGWDRWCESDLIRYMRHREELLAGKKVDPMGF